MSESSLAIEAHGSVKRFPRAQGWGELVRMALEKAVDEGAARMNLLVLEQNRAAVNLYRKMGFRPASILRLDGQLEEEVRRAESADASSCPGPWKQHVPLHLEMVTSSRCTCLRPSAN
ncbi:MAG: GNAT family N-acetyltransferase [Anaerolineae bacterium]